MPIRHLRPVFYTIEDSAAVLSGWINPISRDVFTTKADNEMDVELVPRARPAFQIGERVEFTDTVELYPAEDILPHERGHVAALDEDGAVSIFLEGVHSGLEDNTLIIRPFHDGWILEALRRFVRDESSRTTIESLKRRALSTFSLGVLVASAPWLVAHAEGFGKTIEIISDFLY